MKKTFFALACLTVLVFIRAFGAGYLQWDDNVFIQENWLLHLPIGEFFSNVFTHFFYNDYLPVTLISYWAEIQAFGFSSEAQHAVNLCLHLLNLFLLMKVLQELGMKSSAVVFVALVFAIHPVQTEVVLWISERKGLLAMSFALFSILASLKAENSKRFWLWNFLSVGLFVLSLGSKSTAIFLPALLILQDRLFLQKSWKHIVMKHWLAGLISAIWALVRVQAYAHDISGFKDVGMSWQRWSELPLQILTAFGFYLKQSFWPINQSIIYPLYEMSLGLIVLALVFWGFVLALCWKKKDPLVLYFAIWILIFLGPVLQIVPRINFVNDRYLYFPLIGLTALCAQAFPVLVRKKSFLAILAVTLGFLSFQRSAVWQSNESLWKDTAQKIPSSGIAHNNLGLEYLQQNRKPEAIQEFEAAAKVGERDGTAHLAYHNLGLVHFTKEARAEDLQKAETYFLLSLKLSNNEASATEYNLGLVYLQQGKLGPARQVLETLQRTLNSSQDQRNAGLLQLTEGLLKKIPQAP